MIFDPVYLIYACVGLAAVALARNAFELTRAMSGRVMTNEELGKRLNGVAVLVRAAGRGGGIAAACRDVDDLFDRARRQRRSAELWQRFASTYEAMIEGAESGSDSGDVRLSYHLLMRRAWSRLLLSGALEGVREAAQAAQQAANDFGGIVSDSQAEVTRLELVSALVGRADSLAQVALLMQDLDASRFATASYSQAIAVLRDDGSPEAAAIQRKLRKANEQQRVLLSRTGYNTSDLTAWEPEAGLDLGHLAVSDVVDPDLASVRA